MPQIKSTQNGLPLVRAWSLVGNFAANCRKLEAQPSIHKQVLKNMVDCLAEVVQADRVAFYQLNAFGNLDIHTANKPEVIEESHVKDISPEGPLAVVLNREGFIYIPSILQPEHYYLLGGNGSLLKIEENILNPSVTQRYLKNFGGLYEKTKEDMSMVFGCFSVPGKKYGAFKIDSFPSGRSVLPQGMQIDELLQIVGTVSLFSSSNLAEFEMRMELEKKRQETHEQFIKARDLLNGATHAFRGRITSAIGFAEMIQEGIGSPERIATVIKLLYEAIQSTRAYVEPLREGSFDVTINLSKTSIKGVVSELMLSNIEIKIAKNLPAVLTDKNRLKDVLYELSHNAKKYSPENSPMKIFARRKGKDILIQVIDQGFGLTREQLDLIFDYGTRFHAGAGDSHGAGLYIQKKTIEKMGGKIWAESKGPGKGTTFNILLPAAV